MEVLGHGFGDPAGEFLLKGGLGAATLLGQAKSARAESKENASWRAEIASWEKRFPELMAEFVIPGLSIVVIKDGRVAWRRGFGVKDATSKAPITNDTMLEAASMSKSIFAYAVMKLCEQSTIELDAPLTKYTTEKFLEGDPRLELITTRRVLCHTTGFPDWRSDKEPLKINFTPGEKWSYSGEGYSYLQSVVAHVTGQFIEPYMKAHVFAPFGMGTTGYVWNGKMERLMARPHGEEGEPLKQNRATVEHVTRYGSAGELRTTPTDYARFVIEVISPKPPDAHRLRSDTLKEMLRPQIALPTPFLGLFRSSWALGWQILHTDTDRGDLICHGGDNAGFHSMHVGSVSRPTRGQQGAKRRMGNLHGACGEVLPSHQTESMSTITPCFVHDHV